MTTVAGFLLASKHDFNLSLFIFLIIGVSLVIGSACAFNNYLDRDIDHFMERTKKRALVAGTISDRRALTFATVIGLVGFLILVYHTNWLVVIIGLIGFVDYIVAYTYLKRHSVHATLVGSISGSMPIVAGYCAVTNQVDAAAILLFLVMTVWQMPHFYAIALRRKADYEKAGIPVFPIKAAYKELSGDSALHCSLCGFHILVSALFGYTGLVYAVVVGIAGIWWFIKAYKVWLDR